MRIVVGAWEGYGRGMEGVLEGYGRHIEGAEAEYYMRQQVIPTFSQRIDHRRNSLNGCRRRLCRPKKLAICASLECILYPLHIQEHATNGFRFIKHSTDLYKVPGSSSLLPTSSPFLFLVLCNPSPESLPSQYPYTFSLSTSQSTPDPLFSPLATKSSTSFTISSTNLLT